MSEKQPSTFDLGRLRGKFKPPNLNYVSIEELNIAEEHRITFEIFLAIGSTFLGCYLTSGKYLIIAIISLILSITFLVRFLKMKSRLYSFFNKNNPENLIKKPLDSARGKGEK